MIDHRDRRYGLGYLLLTVGVVLLALSGYAGFRIYPRLDQSAAGGIGLSLLASAAGIASFFSPCSFPLLVTLLARGPGRDQRTLGPVTGLRFALALSIGASLFLLLLGAGIGAGGALLFRQVTFTSLVGRILRATVGLGLILLGSIQVGWIPFKFRVAAGLARPLLQVQAKLRRERPTLGFGLFGFGYVLAGFG